MVLHQKGKTSYKVGSAASLVAPNLQLMARKQVALVLNSKAVRKTYSADYLAAATSKLNNQLNNNNNNNQLKPKANLIQLKKDFSLFSEINDKLIKPIPHLKPF